jgi:uncharacterized protein YkwD
MLRLSAYLWLAASAVSFAQAPSNSATQAAAPQVLAARAHQLFMLANQSRAAVSAAQLQWDAGLAEAALQHCLRMAVEGPIEHRYQGEADLTERAGSAGAHFSIIEENIAVGSYVDTIHQGWLDSPAHRANLLNPDVDRVGVAVVASQGVIFAVADYARAVPVLSPAEVEAAVASLIHAEGVGIHRDPADARAACLLEEGVPAPPPDPRPRYVMRLQAGDLTTRLPQELIDMLRSRQYRRAAVGSCPSRDVGGPFTVYRIAVLLY